MFSKEVKCNMINCFYCENGTCGSNRVELMDMKCSYCLELSDAQSENLREYLKNISLRDYFHSLETAESNEVEALETNVSEEVEAINEAVESKEVAETVESKDTEALPSRGSEAVEGTEEKATEGASERAEEGNEDVKEKTEIANRRDASILNNAREKQKAIGARTSSTEVVTTDELREYFILQGMTVEQVAGRIGKSKSTTYNWLRDRGLIAEKRRKERN